MLSGLADSLGIKEGLAEFRGQLLQDGRALAQEKGVDLSKLEALEEKVVEKVSAKRSAAINALTKDETLAQLLDLKKEETTTPPKTAPSRALRAGFDLTSAELQVELREAKAELAKTKTELTKAKTQLGTLEARCSELSALSDEALSQTEALRRERALWKQRAEELESAGRESSSSEERAEAAARECASWQQKAEELEAAERAARDLVAAATAEKERLSKELAEARQEPRLQELADEVAYLHKSLEAKEQKLQEVTREKECLQQRSVAGKTAARDPESGHLFDAHTAIAAAFGDSLSGPPVVRCFDEPILRFTAFLFRQRFLRMTFFASSMLIWVYALHHIIVLQHG
mmetsp:Transcript_39445/g.91503  ORF Transcript_39445/g.91503 Transcript_39445/m.91503 type:complete len:347 (-) Transcript_39445:60-1100(-)